MQLRAPDTPRRPGHSAALSRTPDALQPRLIWLRAAAIGLAVGVCTLGIAAASARGVDDLSTLHAGFYLCWCIVALASGAAFYLRWRLTGEAAVGLLAAALVVMSVPQLPLAVVDLAADPSESVRRLAPITRLTVLLPAAWLLVRCTRAPKVDRGLRPLRLALGYTVVATACPGAVLTAGWAGVTAAPTPLAPSTAGYAIVALAASLTWLFAARTPCFPPPLGGALPVVFAGTTLGALAELVARRWNPSLLIAADLLVVVSAGLLVFLAVWSLRSALDVAGVRQQALRRRAEEAETAVRREQERLHEMRSTVAGIRHASGTLRQYGEQIEPHRREHLREMMAEEVGRLERLLTPGQRPAHPRLVLLDDIVRPVVLSHREQGTDVRWEPSGARVRARGDEVAEVLDILLSNAREHAPGSVVEILVTEQLRFVRIVVRDHGPGIPVEDARRLFDRGVRRAGSAGQGLGLHIARRLAAGSGGALTLLRPAGARGAHFALTMPAGAPAQRLPTQAGALLEAR